MPVDHRLVEAFRANSQEWRLAGFADLPPDPVPQDWRDLFNWTITEGYYSEKQHARLMWLLLHAARYRYGSAEEDRGYWPVLEDTINEAFANGSRFHLCQARQKHLGDAFRDGLDRFGYDTPDNLQRNVGPILFHAGFPAANIAPLVRIVRRHLYYGDRLPDLDAGTIHGCIPKNNTGLFRSSRDFLCSGSSVVEEVWSPLARVALAHDRGTGVDDALSYLPPFLPVDRVLAALNEEAPVREARQPLPPPPRLSFEAATGRVLLVSNGSGLVRLTHAGVDGRLGGPESRDEGETARHVRSWPGSGMLQAGGLSVQIDGGTPDSPLLWFSSRTGDHHSGPLKPGAWLLVSRGRVEFPSTNVECEVLPADWAFADAPVPWRACRVHLPAGLMSLVCRCEGKETSVSLDRWHGAAPVLERPAAVGFCQMAGQFPEETLTFGEPPALRNPGPHVLAIEWSLLSAPNATTTRQVVPGGSVVLENMTSGVWIVRWRRHSGGCYRLLSRVAVIPGFVTPVVAGAAGGESATVEWRGRESAGRFEAEANIPTETQSDGLRMSTDALSPVLTARWTWSDPASPALSFSLPVPGLRWRVMCGETYFGWSRNCEEFRTDEIRRRGACLELHVPAGMSAQVSPGGALELAPSPHGDCLILELGKYTDSREAFVVSFNGTSPRPLVWFADHPLLNDLRVSRMNDMWTVSWDKNIPDGSVLLAWDALAPERPITSAPLEKTHKESRSWTGAMESMSACVSVGVTLAKPSARGFRRGVWYLARSVDADTPRIARWESPDLTPDDREWLRVFEHIRVNTLAGLSLKQERLEPLLPANKPITRLQPLIQANGTVGTVVSELVRQLAERQPARIGEVGTVSALLAWLRLGIHPRITGRANDENEEPGYPFAYLELSRRLTSSIKLEKSGGNDAAGATLRDACNALYHSHGFHELEPVTQLLPLAMSDNHPSPAFARRHDWPNSLSIPDQGLRERGRLLHVKQFVRLLGADDQLSLFDQNKPSPHPFAIWVPTSSGSRWRSQTAAIRCDEPGPRYANGRLVTGEPFLVPALTPDSIARRVQLFYEFGKLGGEALPVGDPSKLDRLAGRLEQHPRLSAFIRHVREETTPKQVTLAFTKQTIDAQANHPVTPSVRELWLLAWWERMHATQPASEDSSLDPAIGCRLLARWIEEAPRPTERMLVLVEWLRATLIDGGYGFAAKFDFSGYPPCVENT